jgi:hypothetical protein
MPRIGRSARHDRDLPRSCQISENKMLFVWSPTRRRYYSASARRQIGENSDSAAITQDGVLIDGLLVIGLGRPN